ncbi:MAG: RadC family protein [Mycoplasmatales bacterium]
MSKFSELDDNLKPREKLVAQKGEDLNETELLAIILQSGFKDKSVITLSQTLIEKYNGLSGVINSDIEELMTNNGVGIAKASKIKTIKLIQDKIENFIPSNGIKITQPEDVFQITKKIQKQAQENLVVICLDAKANLITNEIVYVGTVDEITIHPREIFNVALKKLSSNIIIVHNHPSGDPSPSAADICATKKILEISKIVGIRLIDHIIVTHNQYYSIRENCDIIF